jgi:hypothetical protein
MPELTRITRDPAVMGGKPCIRGMRVTVGTVGHSIVENDQGRATTANFDGRRVAPRPTDDEAQDLNGFSTFTEPYRWPSERSSE